MEQLGVAVIGTGVMGERYAQVLAQLPNTRLVAVCDRVAEVAQRVAAGNNVRAYTDYREMLEVERGIQAVCVCTSDGDHREPCVAAAQHGIHILVEKPLALTVEDGGAIVQAARTAGVKLMVGHILRFDPRYAGAWESVRAGRIGEPIHAFVRRNNLLSNARRLGGRTSVLFFLGSHDVDFLLWCLQDRPVRVYAAASRKLLADLGVDDTIFAVIHFAGGAIACVEASWVLPEHSPSGLDARVELVGTRGAIYVDVRNQGLTEVTEARLSWPDTVYGPVLHGAVAGALKAELEHFVACVLEDREPVVTGEAALETVRVIAAAHRSLETGLPEPIE